MAWMLGYIFGVLHLLWLVELPDASGIVLTNYWPALLLSALLLVPANKYRIYCFSVLLFIVGAVVGNEMALRTAVQVSKQKLIEQLDGEVFNVDGVIKSSNCRIPENEVFYSYRQPDTRRCKLFIMINTIIPTKDSDNFFSTAPKNIQLSYYGDQAFFAGQHIMAVAKLRSPRQFYNPGSFDSVRYQYAHNIDAYGYIKSLITLSDAGESAETLASHVRSSRLQVLALLFQSLNRGALLSALLLGEKQGVSLHDRALFESTGTLHLMAISGLHIGMIAGLGFILARVVSTLCPNILLYFPRVYLETVFALPLAIFYAVLAGFSIPSQRALIMLAAFFLLRCARINSSIWFSLLLALFVILLRDPIQILDTGLWYSFYAVLMLALACRQVFKFRSSPSETSNSNLNINHYLMSVQQSFGALISTQWVLLLSMPLLLSLVSSNLPLISPLANLLTVPLVAMFIVPLGILGVLLSYVHVDAAYFLFTVADIALDAVVFILDLLSNTSRYRLAQTLPTPSFFQWLCLAIAGLILFTGFSLPGTTAALILWGVSMVSPSYWRTNNIEEGELVITQFDVGQGSAVLISSAQHHWLYDTGPAFSSGFDAGKAVILPYLRKQGIVALDTVIISHGDNDHSGGARSIANAFKVKKWLYSGSFDPLTIESTHSKLQHCQAGHSDTVDAFHYVLLNPDNVRPDIDSSENDSSCVLQIRLKATEADSASNDEQALLLVPGDISRAIEYQLMNLYPTTLATDLLIIAHHGSKTSTSNAWLVATKPAFAMVSNGFNNRYKHPNHNVVMRILKHGIPLHRSDKLGAIQFWYRNGDWEGPFCYRYKARHFWQNYDNSDTCQGRLRKL